MFFRNDVANQMCGEIYMYYFVILAMSLRVPGPWEVNISFQFHKTFGLCNAKFASKKTTAGAYLTWLVVQHIAENLQFAK